ncbi:hypothetical protein K2173_015264 [Erythroxylum novogranatense]|uniref:Protein kinase domain-containing protein n=1 Tax=Erythroxylum novogranatense TaxID=1862640 RepID=A0AAV8T1F9_9ROSI|nr:hypothetical protein K2173_015264 [Erythroxylum novogranatense]
MQDNISQLVLAATVSFLFIIIIFSFFFFICRYQKPSNYAHHRTRRSDRPGTRTVPNLELSTINIDDSASFDPSLNRVSMEELKTATRNFSADLIIGDGSFGLVYKAQLSTGNTVAIKKLAPDAFQGFREFRAEMETLGKLRHRNIVKMLGYCMSGEDRVLIYEFIEKGSLDQWLHDASYSSEYSVKLPLSWETRNKIVNGVADGLAYLHGLDTPIIHRDIKAGNVLLDSEFEAHIADFGLARRVDSSCSHVSTQVAGTMGYMPPEYKNGLMTATVKADVYSFGMLMLEIATGQRPNLPIMMEGKEVVLIEWARKMLEESRHWEMLDPSMIKEGVREDSVKEYLDIATWCTSESRKDRPCMGEVIDLLNHLNSIEEK